MERQDQARGSAGFSEALVESDTVQFAGMALAAGLDPRLVLNCRDPVERVVLEQAVSEATRRRTQERQDLAVRLAEVLVKIL
jgi:hypothetical protein